jgi:hypothetical protein
MKVKEAIEMGFGISIDNEKEIIHVTKMTLKSFSIGSNSRQEDARSKQQRVSGVAKLGIEFPTTGLSIEIDDQEGPVAIHADDLVRAIEQAKLQEV